MKMPKPPPGLLANLAQFALFLVVLGYLLIESPNITWGQVVMRIVVMLLAGAGIMSIEERSDYIHVVVVKDSDGKPVVCETPSWPELSVGDKVLYDTYTRTAGASEFEGVCISKANTLDADEQQLLAAASGTRQPFPRIRGHIKVRRFEYDDEKTPEGADTPTGETDG